MLFFNFAWKPMPPFWDCLKILMGTFTIFWLSWTDSFRIQQIDSFRFLGQIFTPVGNSAMEIPKWIGSSDIDCITHLQYDKLWGLPRRVFTLLTKRTLNGHFPVLQKQTHMNVTEQEFSFHSCGEKKKDIFHFPRYSIGYPRPAGRKNKWKKLADTKYPV